ncbi:MAG: 2-hydroxyglutaryl-CoA dehydratase [Thermotogae bacterium]|nr:2-hydroxyglutaryl-CoA dehydratase [Thermotogota bacterium]
MKRLGICIGSSSISMYDGSKGENVSHNGNPRKVLEKILKGLPNDSLIVVTGKKGRNLLKFPKISEIEATEYAYKALRNKYTSVEAIVSAGGENFTLYKLNSADNISGVYTGNKCASGTGEFFLQQIKRMGLRLEDLDGKKNIDDFYELSSRCSVFCKSDCTHALNKGVPKQLILNGLGKVMAERILDLMNQAKVRKIMLVGGTTRVKVMLNFLSKHVEIVIPEEAIFFEAFGAYKFSEINYKKMVYFDLSDIFNEIKSTFPTHKPLKQFMDMVEFKDMEFKKAVEGDECILGLDVGSTTTKAVLMRVADNAILASVYLRTLGDPVRASRECYKKLKEQLDCKVNIIGLGVTGSGRKISGLHAQTKTVYNEIMAHAKAAAFFDKDVDTIFEIGGQDAKYTFLSNGVAVDYAMNEACSAGTGSFLEEAASESLGIHYTKIADLALKGDNPPNFSDQCAAFIGSDIKTAIQEGISKENICAGLVYSICMNYVNRVKGNRPVGKKVFMQGGVCYNKAVPIAMAALVGKRIVVPPHPGLMGAYGVALMVKENIELGFAEPAQFDLEELINREAIYRNEFICPGGKTKCDRRCKIRIIEIDGKKFPFGGACNLYENIRMNLKVNVEEYNHVKRREILVFEMEDNSKKSKGLKIGISKSLAMNNLFPLFYTFFKELGLEVVVPDSSDKEGWEFKKAEFCFPVELSHGFMYNLLKKDVDYIFLPAIRGIKVENSENYNVFCPFVQSEPNWLMAAFSELEKKRLIREFFDFSEGIENEREKFIEIAQRLGQTREKGLEAFKKGLEKLEDVGNKIKSLYQELKDSLEKEEFAIVIFGRSYNAFTSVANMGIPEKLASRGIHVIPFDALPFENEKGYEKMYWTWGEMILKAARYVKKSDKLFGVYITNFSCGPDSFIISFFRDIMGDKPSLVLELDSHTADAGIETRIEAFVDVVNSYIRLKKEAEKPKKVLRPQLLNKNGRFVIYLPDKKKALSIKDKRVKVVFPTMGEFGAKCLAASFKYHGVRTFVCPKPGEIEFKLGRGNTLSKECLPMQLTLGSLIRYLQNRDEDEITIYFMPDTRGPCRFGQYSNYINLWLDRNRVERVALLSLNSENAYAGLGLAFKMRAWMAIVISDIFNAVSQNLKVLAKNRSEAIEVIKESSEKILESLANQSMAKIYQILQEVAEKFSKVEKRFELEEVPKIILTGEIYVRNDEFSRKNLENFFEDHGIIMHVSPIQEWMYYLDYLFLRKIISPDSKFKDKLYKFAEIAMKRYVEKKVKGIFSRTGFYEPHLVDIKSIVKAAQRYFDIRVTGEAILTIGTALYEIVREYDGVISIGPFGCMPSRIAEAIIKRGISDLKNSNDKRVREVAKIAGDFPVVSLESDGNPFSPIIESRLDAFVVQVRRMHEILKKN